MEKVKVRDALELPSERSFGWVFTVLFALIALWPLLSGGSVRPLFAAIAAVLLVITLIIPRILRPFNVLWARFGLLLHKIMTPVIMGVLFFGVITPMALFRRLLGKDSLRLRYDAGEKSYWIVREEPGPSPESMKRQF